MPIPGDILFECHPDPMWIYDRETLRFLEVNDSAIAKYGYSRDEFLAMTIKDIRPAEDVPRLLETVASLIAGFNDAGIWRHCLKSGEIISVVITAHTLDHDGTRAELVSARDVTRLLALEEDKANYLKREQVLRQEAEASAHLFQSLFESAPGQFLVLTPDEFRIVAASDAYLNATSTRREDIKGRRMFDVFPDDPDDSKADGVRNLRASLEQVKVTGMSDILPVQRYPIPRPKDQGGGFAEHFWSCIHTPIKGADGNIVFIMLRAEDVTEFVYSAEGRLTTRGSTATEEHDGAQLELDILLRSRELKIANSRLQEQEASLRTAKRLLKLGIWKLNLDSDVLSWSDDIYEMYDIAPEEFGHCFDAYLGLMHPDDRQGLVDELNSFLEKPDAPLQFRHRIPKPDGSIMHVQGMGELANTADGRLLTGVVQNITDQVLADSQLAEAASLQRIAGQAAHLGGWRFDLQTKTMQWSKETAEIHDVGPQFQPTLQEAINFYTPEYRNRFRRIFDACAERGESFSEVMPKITATGRPIWVRSTGEAEYDAEGNICAVRGAFQDITDHINAREQSKTLSQQLEQTLESMSDGFFTLDRDFNFTFVNDEFCRVLNKRRDALIGNNIRQCFPAAANSAFRIEYEAALATQTTRTFTQHYSELNLWLRVKAYPSIDGLAIYFQDVTQERAREQHLRLLESAVSRQNDILLITEAEPMDEPEGPRIIYVNDAFERRTGYRREEVIGQTPRFLQGPKTQQAELDRIREALTHWQPVRAELINYTKSGDEFWLEMDIVPLADESGWYTHWIAVERDITDRKMAERAVRQSDERFQLVTKATNDVIWDWDLVQDSMWWNDNLKTMFGYDPVQITDGLQFWVEHLHPEDRNSVLAELYAVFSSDDITWQGEYRFLHANGKALSVVDRGFITRDTSGKAIRMVGSMVDVTELREMDERLRQSQKLEAVGHLTGGIAHDFNNLLTVILGNAEFMQEQLTDQPDLKRLAEMTVTAAERGAELTNRLLAFARRQALQPRRVNINKLVTDTLGLLKRALNEDIELTFVDTGELWTTEIDPGQLEVALLNLAINARDAMPEGGRLLIETANTLLDEAYVQDQVDVTAGEYVQVSVSDSGTGMAADTLSQAFDPFFTTKMMGKGSGLGLSMVYGFVKQSGGHARIYSEENEGTTIRLYFPRTGATDEVPYQTPQEIEPRGGSEHILVVEDDDQVRTYVTNLLKSLGYRVTAARSGAEALDILTEYQDIDLLFTDVVMPGGINGRQLSEQALSIHPHMKVLFTSGYSENAIIHNGRLDKGVQLISKPYHREQLAQKLREILDPS